jgi:hypothetical protein
MAPRAWNMEQGAGRGMEEDYGRGPRSWLSHIRSGQFLYRDIAKPFADAILQLWHGMLH